MILYDPARKVITFGKAVAGAYPEETPLYCGEAIHPFIPTLLAYKTDSLTLQEAFTALLLEPADNKRNPLYLIKECVDECFGEEAWYKVEQKFIDRRLELKESFKSCTVMSNETCITKEV